MRTGAARLSEHFGRYGNWALDCLNWKKETLSYAFSGSSESSYPFHASPRNRLQIRRNGSLVFSVFRLNAWLSHLKVSCYIASRRPLTRKYRLLHSSLCCPSYTDIHLSQNDHSIYSVRNIRTNVLGSWMPSPSFFWIIEQGEKALSVIKQSSVEQLYVPRYSIYVVAFLIFLIILGWKLYSMSGTVS